MTLTFEYLSGFLLVKFLLQSQFSVFLIGKLFFLQKILNPDDARKFNLLGFYHGSVLLFKSCFCEFFLEKF